MTTPQLNFAQSQIDAAQAVLARIEPGKVTKVTTLTDEEITILDGLETPQIVATPWVADNESFEPEAFGEVALRGLIARGDVQPAIVEGRDDLAIVAVPDITGPLLLRRISQAIISIERTTSLQSDYLYYYRHDDAVLEEQIDAAGFHLFSILELADLGTRFASFVNPSRAEAGNTFVRELTRSELEIGLENSTISEINEAVAVSRIGVVRSGSDDVVVIAVYAGPAGLSLLRGDPTREDGDSGPVVLASTTHEGLKSIPNRLFSGAFDPNARG
jgi:hypothetical protein